MEAAAPPTATSISPCGFFSLSTWMILESCNCCLCFFLPHFTMPHPACTAAIAKKSLQQYLLLLHFLAPKHNEVASLEEVFLHKQGSKGFRLISVLFDQSHMFLIQQSAIGFDQPLSPRFVEVRTEQVEKNTQPTNLYFFTNCDMLWFAQYICELINWKFCLQDFYCVQ